MSVYTKPDFNAPITSKRCVLLVDAFLVTSPQNIHDLIHMRNKERPFAMAGLYDYWKDPKTSVVKAGFTIITAWVNAMLRKIGVDHMPVILAQKNVAQWLNLKTDHRHYLPMIHTFPDDVMNGYPVSGKILSESFTNKLLQPVGSKLKPDERNLPGSYRTG
jgi:putative SOS response-associated peptidase YedK